MFIKSLNRRQFHLFIGNEAKTPADFSIFTNSNTTYPQSYCETAMIIKVKLIIHK